MIKLKTATVLCLILWSCVSGFFLLGETLIWILVLLQVNMQGSVSPSHSLNCLSQINRLIHCASRLKTLAFSSADLNRQDEKRSIVLSGTDD